MVAWFVLNYNTVTTIQCTKHTTNKDKEECQSPSHEYKVINTYYFNTQI